MMSKVADCMTPQFIISTGDNFYDYGLKSKTDPQWGTSFLNVYNTPRLAGIPWYSVLGNHDYGLGQVCPAATLTDNCYSAAYQYTANAPDSRWNLAAGTWQLPAALTAGGKLNVIFTDTSPIIYPSPGTAGSTNFAGLASQNKVANAAALEAALQASTAQWNVVVGHHPIWSWGVHCNFNGKDQDCAAMQAAYTDTNTNLGNTFLSKTHLYLAGHEHDMQQIFKPAVAGDATSQPQGPIYGVSGAGSINRANEFDNLASKQPWFGNVVPYATSDNGFLVVRVRSDKMDLLWYSAAKTDGPAYKYSRIACC